MRTPRAGDIIRIGQSDISAAVIGEIQVVVAKRIHYPIRHLDQRGSLDIATHSSIHFRSDDRTIAKTGDSDVGWLCCLQGRKAKKNGASNCG